MRRRDEKLAHSLQAGRGHTTHPQPPLITRTGKSADAARLAVVAPPNSASLYTDQRARSAGVEKAYRRRSEGGWGSRTEREKERERGRLRESAGAAAHWERPVRLLPIQHTFADPLLGAQGQAAEHHGGGGGGMVAYVVRACGGRPRADAPPCRNGKMSTPSFLHPLKPALAAPKLAAPAQPSAGPGPLPHCPARHYSPGPVASDTRGNPSWGHTAKF